MTGKGFGLIQERLQLLMLSRLEQSDQIQHRSRGQSEPWRNNSLQFHDARKTSVTVRPSTATNALLVND